MAVCKYSNTYIRQLPIRLASLEVITTAAKQPPAAAMALTTSNNERGDREEKRETTNLTDDFLIAHDTRKHNEPVPTSTIVVL